MRLSLNSYFRKAGPSDTYTQNLGRPIQVRELKIGNIVIPNSYDNVVSTNNISQIIDSTSVNRSGNLPTGRYTMTQLLATLNTFVTAQNNGVAVTFSIGGTGYITMATAAPISLIVERNSIFFMLGFGIGVFTGANLTATNGYFLGRTRCIYVMTDIRFADESFVSDDVCLNNAYNCLTTVPIDIDFDNGRIQNIVYESEKELDPFKMSNPYISAIQLTLLDSELLPLSLNGHDWTCDLIFNKTVEV